MELDITEKQGQLNNFVKDLETFITRYYASKITNLQLVPESDHFNLILQDQHNNKLTIYSYDAEITLELGESHWHISSMNEIASIYERTIDDLFAILNGKITTYSVWKDDQVRGGGTARAGMYQKDPVEAASEFFNDIDEIRIAKWNTPLEIIKV